MSCPFSNQSVYHVPVLVKEVLQSLESSLKPVILDVTLGGGGHTRALLEAYKEAVVYALDWDKESLDIVGPQLTEEYPDRFFYVQGNFADLYTLAKKHSFPLFSAVLADFGTSQWQIRTRAGLSFETSTFLDMRLSTTHSSVTAATILNEASEKELCFIFEKYGEQPGARHIARAICQARIKKRIKTTQELCSIVCSVIKGPRGKTHPATRIFQALRIAVNKELEHIHVFLTTLSPLLEEGGRVACISFHSLEDRIVKQFFKTHEQEYEVLTRSVIQASDEEKKKNPSSRSARLRVARKRSCT